MNDPSAGTSNVFLFTIAPAAGLCAGELEAGLRQRTAAFALASRPHLAPSMLAHRILRGADGEHVESTLLAPTAPLGG